MIGIDEALYKACEDNRKLEDELEQKDKEIERLKKQNNDLRKIYRNTYKKLFDKGNDELACYFQAQIDDCPTFYVEPIIDYYKENQILNNIIDELEKYIDDNYFYDDVGMKIFDVSLLEDKIKELKGGVK